MATIDAKAREVLAASSSAQSTPPALSRQNSTAAEGAGAAARAEQRATSQTQANRCPKRALSLLVDQLPNNEKAEWATMQHRISGENDFNKFRNFLKHRKDILDAVDTMETRKDMPKDPDKPDPNQNVCDYCGMTRHLEKDCRRKKNDDEAGTPGATRGSRGSSRGRGNVLDQRGQRDVTRMYWKSRRKWKEHKQH